MDATTPTQVVVLHDCMIEGEVAMQGTVITLPRAKALRMQSLEAVSLDLSGVLPQENNYESMTSKPVVEAPVAPAKTTSKKK